MSNTCEDSIFTYGACASVNLKCSNERTSFIEAWFLYAIIHVQQCNAIARVRGMSLCGISLSAGVHQSAEQARVRDTV